MYQNIYEFDVKAEVINLCHVFSVISTMAELDVVREETDPDANSETCLKSPSDDPLPESSVSQYLMEHTCFTRQWFLENASPDMISEWLVGHGYWPNPEVQDHSSLTDSYARATSSGRNSVTSELFQDMVVCPKKKRGAPCNSL